MSHDDPAAMLKGMPKPLADEIVSSTLRPSVPEWTPLRALRFAHRVLQDNGIRCMVGDIDIVQEVLRQETNGMGRDGPSKPKVSRI